MDVEDVRAVRIQNTLHVGECWVSPALLPELATMPHITVLEEGLELLTGKRPAITFEFCSWWSTIDELSRTGLVSNFEVTHRRSRVFSAANALTDFGGAHAVAHAEKETAAI